MITASSAASQGPSQHKDEHQLALARSLHHVPWCDQYERMISGMLYDPLDPALVHARLRVRAWAQWYNTNLLPDPDEVAAASADGDGGGAVEMEAAVQRRALAGLRSVVGAVVGDDIVLEPPVRFDYGCNVRLGKMVYANFNLTVLDCALVTIGDRVMMGPNVSLLAATHQTDVRSRRDNVEYARPIMIGDDCWIGGHVVVLPGVVIGRGCTVAAGSVVSRSVPEFSVVMGVPAKVVKKVAPVE